MTPIWFVRIPLASGLTEQEADEFQWMRVDQVTGEPAKTRPSLPGWLALNLLSHAYEKGEDHTALLELFVECVRTGQADVRSRICSRT